MTSACRKIAAPNLAEPPNATWSNGLVIGNEVVLSGMTARGGDGRAMGGASVEGQMLAVLDKIQGLVEAAGGGAHNIYKLVVYVTDIGRKDEVNAARAAFFRPHYPCSTLVEVSGLVFPDLLVEVDAFANLAADLRA
ncbi:RidA family protein [Ferrovibrio sp.]|uniref:RidA family protein n=1 Tax=Ferrovibrio sp. TaxID=1917215 RepID=UPI0026371CE5|nr:RidA family protein [Ferrovibrio sp.]